ncbi:MAG: hypothetical protein K1X44_08705 [Alphaproteobacteria bacterium]|nr:hypothetical protein [Alphaproteobacteria bacterium]
MIKSLINLVPMTGTEFDLFLRIFIPEFAADKILSGNGVKEEALERSRQEYAKLLPQGLTTPNHYFFTVKLEVQQKRIGWLWLFVENSNAYIYEITIDEPYSSSRICYSGNRTSRI